MTINIKEKVKFVIFSIIPTIVLILCSELFFRFTGLAGSSIFSMPLTEETIGLNQPDEDLFWSMRPNLKIYYEATGVSVRTNSFGLRSPEIGTKKDNEFRILSLGESTTYGEGVSNDETYSAVLENILQNVDKTRSYRVINAGVSAYSSFQSLTYLKLRGLKLKPDMVLFYHELNDYLPSSLRDSSNNEFGVSRSDKQVYFSKKNMIDRQLLKYSASYRFIKYRIAMYKIKNFQKKEFHNPLTDVGLPNIGILPLLQKKEGGQIKPADLSEQALPSRVLHHERLEILKELLYICKANNIRLLIIHPSYAASEKHSCILTDFCKTNKVDMLEAYDVLHPPGGLPDVLYSDAWHPNRIGHKFLAEAILYHLLNAKIVIPQ